ncbi:MAG TPA: hypothetical protein VEL05_08665, partial [Candidatus Acidoferrum sp.]|nr:hypothetical protein [Candidatus Acidoferrum sp.]
MTRHLRFLVSLLAAASWPALACDSNFQGPGMGGMTPDAGGGIDSGGIDSGADGEPDAGSPALDFASSFEEGDPQPTWTNT